MYGKSTPQGSGNGWSGWYKGWYFRSLRELSYVINEIEKNNKVWKSADTKDLRIKYVDYKGDERTYSADFLVDNQYLVEIKPDKLKSSVTNRAKTEAAKKFCQKNNLTYIIKEPIMLTEAEIDDLYSSNQITFIKRYEDKYNDRKKNRK